MSNNLIGRKVAKEASISFGGMGIGSFFRYLFSIMMARWLGPQMLGIYSLGNAITRIAEIFGIMGLDNGVHRYVSCLLYSCPSPRDPKTSRMPSSA